MFGLFRRRPPPPPAVAAYLAAPDFVPRGHWRGARFAVIDVETTGLNSRRDALLAVGLVEIESAQVRLDTAWYSLIRPPAGMEVPADSIRVHRLMRGDVAQAPAPEGVLAELLQRLAGRVLVVHFASVDVEFLNRALRRHFGCALRAPILDTARLADFLNTGHHWVTGRPHAGAPSIALSKLAERARLPVFSEHHALSDAATAALLLLYQATKMEQKGQGRLIDLVRAGGV